ncbi:MAG: hypothetical protein EA357_09605 [Micavibrio sp.]|nr:MAG: hypothetical protein EA357_09605 [Micavibrio sp.]
MDQPEMEKKPKPSGFGDRVADQTEWQFLDATDHVDKDVYRLGEGRTAYVYTYKPTIKSRLTAWSALILGAVILVRALLPFVGGEGSFFENVQGGWEDIIFDLIIAAILLWTGVAMLGKPSSLIKFNNIERFAEREQEKLYYDEIHAVQLVVSGVDANGVVSHRVNFQLNFVLRDAGRFHIMNYKQYERARTDAETIAGYIGGVPFWDVIELLQRNQANAQQVAAAESAAVSSEEDGEGDTRYPRS